jgi:hypothetical protein
MPHAELSFKGTSQLLRRAQPRSGAFPPRAAKTSTSVGSRELLQASARLRAVRTLGERRPRMVKRRNSPFASHDRRAVKRTPLDSRISMLQPKAVVDPVHRRSVARWALNKPDDR